MTEPRKIRHSYGCVKETDMMLLKRMPKVTATVESILGREQRKFYIAEIDMVSLDDEVDKKSFKVDEFGGATFKRRKMKVKWKVMVDVVTGTMYDFFSKDCLSSTRLRIID